MEKEIKYDGLSVIPSPYESPDGQMSTLMNLLNENGSIEPLKAPADIMQVKPREKILLIHQTPDQRKNIIFAKQGENGATTLFWKEFTTDTLSTDNPSVIADVPDIIDISAVGNILVLALSTSVSYCLWKENRYIFLGKKPPFLTIEFGMDKSELSDRTTFKGEFGVLFASGGQTTHGTWRYDDERKKALSEITTMVYGQLLSVVNEQIHGKGYFYQPFFIRYAFRMFDGSYAWHSAPVLMLPNVIPPTLYQGEIRGNDGIMEIDSTLIIPSFRLLYHIVSDNSIEEILKWRDLVKGIDIFVSAPIYTFDQSKDIEGHSAVTTLKNFYYRNSWATYTGASHTRPGAPSDLASSTSGGKRPPSRGDDGSAPSMDYFIGHFRDNDTDADHKGLFIDHFINEKDIPDAQVWNIHSNEHFIEDIKNSHIFYKIAELAIDDLKSMDKFEPIELSSSDFVNLTTRKTLPDDFASHRSLHTEHLHAYNNRINLGGVTYTPPEPLPVRSVAAATDGDKYPVFITVWSRTNGCITEMHQQISANSDRFPDLSVNFPRYIFYPDSDAFKMKMTANGKSFTFNLVSHDFLNGAYCFTGLAASPLPEESSEESDAPLKPVRELNKVYTSLVNNPLLFQPENINSVGNGRIIGLSSASKALSQGQFGQFPLYAFTSDGVWALEISSTGGISAKQPFTRDVCLDSKSICQIDSAVLFPSSRGLMLLAGSDSSCISEIINTDLPFDLSALPFLTDILKRNSPGMSSHLNIVPFSSFISHCRLIYDYPHQRIYMFNPHYDYAYLLSLKSNKWSMTFSEISYGVNSYPDAIAVTKSGTMVNFADPPRRQLPGFLVTRPLKLDHPDILKTIFSVLQRGVFRHGSIKSALYASRDMLSWQLVASSDNHRMSGFSGSPYKYFRIALLCELDDGESINGASLLFTPRYTNKLR